jgi:hypothetical protein
VEAEKRDQRLFDQACNEVKALAPGWDRDRVMKRIEEIHLFAATIRKEEEFVSLYRRRRIAHFARCLHNEIELAGIGIGTVEQRDVFQTLLHLLTSLDGVVRLPGQGPQNRSKRGGARRSGLRLFKGSVLERIVRLYREAHANPRFSSKGPLVRFANTVGELVLDTATPFPSNAVKAEFQKMKRKAALPHR